MNVFYDHLTNIYELHLEFDRLNLPPRSRNELIQLADSAVHHEIFDLLMVEIPAEHRTYFLEIFSSDPSNPEILTFLNDKVPGIEDKIKQRAEVVKGQFAHDVRSKK